MRPRRGAFSILGICGLFLASALLAIPPIKPGLSWDNARIAKGVAIYLAMAVLGALCSLLATALALSAPHFASGMSRKIGFGALLESSALKAAVPLALLVLLEAQTWAAIPAAAVIAGSIALSCAATWICARAYSASAAAAGVAVRWKAAVPMSLLVTAFIALFFVALWLLAVSVPATLLS